MSDCLCPLKEAALEAPQEIGFRSIESSLSFASLHALVEREVSELERLGLSEGDRLAVCLPTSVRFYTLLFAALRLGAVFCPLNMRLPPAALAAHISQLSPRLFISATHCWQGARICDKTGATSSLLLFTSGSTSSPKIALLSLANILANARSAISFSQLSPRDTWLLSLPLHHVGGLSILFRCLLARACVSIDPTNRAITHLSYVPAQLHQSWPIYPHLRCLLLGGGPIRRPPPQLPISVSYGMTETASLVLGCKHPDTQYNFPYLGRPLPGKEIKRAEDGELWVRGDSVFQGYWSLDGVHAPFDQDGWFATNDLGDFDQHKGFVITGRRDNQFVSGGENIQPEEIEQHILQHPEILEAIVVPIEDARFGHRPVACLRTIDPSIDLQHIQNSLREQLPKYKLPAAFVLLDESAQTGLKISRKKILEFVQKKIQNRS